MKDMTTATVKVDNKVEAIIRLYNFLRLRRAFNRDDHKDGFFADFREEEDGIVLFIEMDSRDMTDREFAFFQRRISEVLDGLNAQVTFRYTTHADLDRWFDGFR